MSNKKTREYTECTAYLSGHEVIGKRVGGKAFADFGVPSTSAAVFIGDLLTEYLRRNKSYNCNKTIILGLYRAIVKFYSRTEIEAIVRCYVENVGIGSKLFRLSDTFQMKSLSPLDIAAIYNSNKAFRRFYSGPWKRNSRLKYIKGVLKVRFSSRIAFDGDEPIASVYDPQYHGQRIINNMLTSLRLHTLGDVNSSPATLQVLQLPFSNEERPSDDNLFRTPKHIDNLEPHRYRHIRQTFNDITRFRETQTDPDLLLNRLWVTSHRSTNEDVIVDSCIAMETLVKSYLATKDKARLSSRDMALHIAHLVGRSSNKRREVFEIVTEGFKLRNEVVHGGRMRVKNYDPLWNFALVLRHAIRVLVEQSPNVTRNKIEDMLF